MLGTDRVGQPFNMLSAVQVLKRGPKGCCAGATPEGERLPLGELGEWRADGGTTLACYNCLATFDQRLTRDRKSHSGGREMRSALHGAKVLCVVAVLGCGAAAKDSTSPRVTPPEFSRSEEGRAGTGVQVNGDVTIALPDFNNALEHYSVSAVRHRDGSVAGELEETSQQQGGQHIHARVYCVTVTGNTARLAARLEKSNVPFGPVGSYVVWSVIDNGHGRRAPDQTTDIFFGGTEDNAKFHCATGYNLAPYYNSIRGNLEVGTDRDDEDR